MMMCGGNGGGSSGGHSGGTQSVSSQPSEPEPTPTPSPYPKPDDDDSCNYDGYERCRNGEPACCSYDENGNQYSFEAW